MLPGIDGLEVCRRIQKARHVPVLMLTARDDETDLVVGLAIGADDYLTKPFSIARARRTGAGPAPPGRTRPASRHRSPRRAARRHRDRPGAASGASRRRGVHLTPTEFDLLVCLLDRPGRVLTRERLLVEVWGYRDGSGARTVDSHVRALRRKLGDDVVRTVHGVGYALGDSPAEGRRRRSDESPRRDVAR